MASYKKFEDCTQVWIEQNIWDNGELKSYDATIETVGGTKTSVLYFYETNDGNRFYLLGLLESLDLSTIKVVASDLSNVLKFKTAKVRRKHIFELIRENELKIERRGILN